MVESCYNESYDGRRIELSIGAIIKITLPENSTTGFQWSAPSIDGDGLELQGSDYVPAHEDESAGVGAGGTRVFKLRALGRGEFQLRTERCQAWEPDNPDRHFRVIITVD